MKTAPPASCMSWGARKKKTDDRLPNGEPPLPCGNKPASKKNRTSGKSTSPRHSLHGDLIKTDWGEGEFCLYRSAGDTARVTGTMVIVLYKKENNTVS